MKYYLLLVINLPLLSSEQPTNYLKQFFDHMLVKDHVDEIIKALPTISEANLKKEELAQARLELFIEYISEDIATEKRIIDALDIQANLAKQAGKTHEHRELSIKQAQREYRLVRFEAYLDSVSTLNDAIKERIETYKVQKEPFAGITLNFVKL